MLPHRIARSSRIPLIRPLRPPSRRRASPNPRYFTENTQRPYLQPRHSRPQIPYLSQPVFQGPLQRQISRLLSTESREAIRTTARVTTKTVGYGLLFGACLLSIGWGINIEKSERRKPTPPEWGFWTREMMRDGRYLLDETKEAGGIVDWPKVGAMFGKLLVRLESEHVEGKDVKLLPGSVKGTVEDGVERMAYDLSARSYEYRTGYFEVCMAAAAAAEQLDSAVMDRSRRMLFPRQVMIGPSNPDPRPVMPGAPAAPREENCVRAYVAPESAYFRVLLGLGFTTKQRLEAALAYANWLEFKGLSESAEEVYKWGVDIANAGASSEATSDGQTVMLNESSSPNNTPNVLRATTDLASFYARSGNVSTALPMLLSVLRARRTAPLAPTYLEEEEQNVLAELGDSKQKGLTFLDSVVEFFTPPAFPPPPPSGDTPLIRESEQPSCEESELMVYIGEIIFATSKNGNEGLAWTRQGVNTANTKLEALEKQHFPEPHSLWTLLLADFGKRKKVPEAERCKDCLLAGVLNWETMLQRLIEERPDPASSASESNSSWRSWFGGSSSSAQHFAQLEDELAQVATLKERIIREGIGKEMFSVKGQTSGGTWIG